VAAHLAGGQTGPWQMPGCQAAQSAPEASQSLITTKPILAESHDSLSPFFTATVLERQTPTHFMIYSLHCDSDHSLSFLGLLEMVSISL